MKKKGFTLIELLAVLVILAIIALITIPIVIRTINNSEEESEKQSILGYARAIEDDIANYMMINAGKKYTDYVLPDNLDYKGNDVKCSNHNVSSDGKLTMACCKVVGGTGTGYNYESGKVEKSTDTSCNAKDDSGDNPENNSEDIINNKTYDIGEEVTVRGEEYNVIGEGSDYVTLLKQEPLTVAEVNTYGGEGTENNHVNKYVRVNAGTAYNYNGYGGMAYYSSPTCGYVNGSFDISGCESENAVSYITSEIKYVVDAWAADKFTSTDLKEVEGYKARLVQKEELRSQFYPSCSESASTCYSESTTPSWLYAPNEEYWYWTMTQWNDSSSNVWDVHTDGGLYSYYVYDGSGAVRPVINLYKSALNS